MPLITATSDICTMREAGVALHPGRGRVNHEITSKLRNEQVTDACLLLPSSVSDAYFSDAELLCLLRIAYLLFSPGLS